MGVTMDSSHGEFILTHPDINLVHMQVFANYSIVALLFSFHFCEVGKVAYDRNFHLHRLARAVILMDSLGQNSSHFGDVQS
jgi:hypothetical protein